MSDHAIPDLTYKRRIRAWAMYDWANSAFATTILAAVLPVYYSKVAGATLPNPATATQYWSLTLTISVLIIALISPILGTMSDLLRGKKKFLGLFLTFGVIGTSLLYFVGEGDWLYASACMVLAYVGFGAANVFYDSLLPHITTENDQDRVSSFGYALGFLGGGILLALNAVMISQLQGLQGTLGVRASFVSVAVWWLIFSLPLFFIVPEPDGYDGYVGKKLGAAELVKTSFSQLSSTLKDIQKYRDLFRFLISFLIYNDGISAVFTIAAIYGAELGFESTELILAILLVQFVGVPYSLIFGSLPTSTGKRQARTVAFVIYNMITLPLIGIGGRLLFSPETTGLAVNGERANDLPFILALLITTQLLGLLFAWFAGPAFFQKSASTLDTKRSIMIALIMYSIIAIWGFFLDSAIEFWFLAWMVATVQGGSQALSRSLYASMAPRAKSGEFFGFYSILSKFATLFTPLIFFVSVAIFGSSRPGILSLVAVFLIGLFLLRGVNVKEGRIVAKLENERLMSQ